MRPSHPTFLFVLHSWPPATWALTAAPVWECLLSRSLTTSTRSCPALKSPHLKPRSFFRKSTVLLRGVMSSWLTAVFFWLRSSELVLRGKTELVTQDISQFTDLKWFFKLIESRTSANSMISFIHWSQTWLNINHSGCRILINISVCARVFLLQFTHL